MVYIYIRFLRFRVHGDRYVVFDIVEIQIDDGPCRAIYWVYMGFSMFIYIAYIYIYIYSIYAGLLYI